MTFEKVTIGNATLYRGDCMEVMQSFGDAEFSLAVTDPPYFDGSNKSGYYGKGYSSLGVQRAKHYDSLESWEVPEAEYFLQLCRVSSHQVIWGANHFSDRFQSAAPGWLVWDKANGGSSFADAELAYCSKLGAVRLFRYVWNGMFQGKYGGDMSKNEPRIHPTQKPTQLYEWAYITVGTDGGSVLDTHLGSGSSAIAANRMGIPFVGIELDGAMFEAACKRIEDAQRMGDMFGFNGTSAEDIKPQQEALL